MPNLCKKKEQNKIESQESKKAATSASYNASPGKKRAASRASYRANPEEKRTASLPCQLPTTTCSSI